MTEEPNIIKQLRELDQDLGLAIKRIDRIENHQLQIAVSEQAADIVKRIDEISNYECHNRALIDELQKDLPMRIQERVEKLEKENLMRQDTIACVDRAYDEECEQLHKRLESLEFIVKEIGRFQEITNKQYQYITKKTDPNENIDIEIQVHEMQQNISCLFTSLKGVETKLMGNPFQPLKPHKCPVCDGCGNDKGTTESNPNFEFCMKYASCHACEGKGIVWG